MTVRQQAVILNIRYDDELADPPATWSWPDLLDCKPEDVQVVMTGEIVASSDPVLDPTHHRKEPS